MLVTCPHCGFLTAPIDAGDGEALHCPRCGGVLDAADTTATGPDAVDASPSPAADSADADANAATPPSADPAQPSADAPAADPVADGAAAPAAAARKRSRAAAAPRGRNAPSFVRGDAPVPAARRAQRREWIALGVLAALLPLQLLLAQRDELATQARWRPLLTGVCAVLRCDLPEWREPAAFALLDRSVQPKPGAAGVLKVSASFRNDARWAQPWPTLRLSLSDIDGREAGARAFAPAEYRRGHAASDVLAPGQSALVEFDVIEPAPNIVAFSFEFE